MLETINPLGQRVRKRPSDALSVAELKNVTNLYLSTFEYEDEDYVLAISTAELAGLDNFLGELELDLQPFRVYHVVKTTDARYDFFAQNGYTPETSDVPGYVFTEQDGDEIRELLGTLNDLFNVENVFATKTTALCHAMRFLDAAVAPSMYLHNTGSGILVGEEPSEDALSTERLTLVDGVPVLTETTATSEEESS